MAVAVSGASAAAGQDEVRHVQMLIDGAWVDAARGGSIAIEAPGTRRTIASVPRGGAEDIDRAVKAATAAFPAWSRVVPRERGRLLQKIADALEARVEELARVIEPVLSRHDAATLGDLVHQGLPLVNQLLALLHHKAVQAELQRWLELPSSVSERLENTA